MSVPTGIPVGEATVVGVPGAQAMASSSSAEDLSQLYNLGYPPGLVDALKQSSVRFPLRIWVVDNSGSMSSTDGQKLVKGAGGELRPVKCTRWAELQDTVIAASNIAVALNARTDFVLLNPRPEGQHFTVANNSDYNVTSGIPCDLNKMRTVMATPPGQGTPLTEAVQKIITMLSPVADKMNAHGQQAVVVLATDGLPNHADSFVHAVQELQRLPVWLIVRLCTNEANVVEYWDDIDKKLEAPIEVLDDVSGEAEEVRSKNKFLTYCPQLHSAREFGLQSKLFDLLDETTLIPTQAKELIEQLIGGEPLPEPELGMAAFTKALSNKLKTVPPVYDPISKKMKPWADIKALEKMINKDGGCVIS